MSLASDTPPSCSSVGVRFFGRTWIRIFDMWHSTPCSLCSRGELHSGQYLNLGSKSVFPQLGHFIFPAIHQRILDSALIPDECYLANTVKAKQPTRCCFSESDVKTPLSLFSEMNRKCQMLMLWPVYMKIW